jgi:hypothetical protein
MYLAHSEIILGELLIMKRLIARIFAVASIFVSTVCLGTEIPFWKLKTESGRTVRQNLVDWFDETLVGKEELERMQKLVYASLYRNAKVTALLAFKPVDLSLAADPKFPSGANEMELDFTNPSGVGKVLNRLHLIVDGRKGYLQDLMLPQTLAESVKQVSRDIDALDKGQKWAELKTEVHWKGDLLIGKVREVVAPFFEEIKQLVPIELDLEQLSVVHVMPSYSMSNGAIEEVPHVDLEFSNGLRLSLGSDFGWVMAKNSRSRVNGIPLSVEFDH